MRRLLAVSSTSLALGAVLVTTAATPAAATPPNIPSAATAKSRLATLTVRAEGSSSGYSRDLFPHWITVSGTCNTRETVLKRDGTGVTTDANCAATSGSWYSPYDGRTWTSAAAVDIDHMVPLAEAWRSGANTWTTDRRRAYANDLGGPELWAVTDTLNQAKGDKDPAKWQPPSAGFRCTYARAWVQVKYYYALAVDTAEKNALTTMLNSC
ncbi:HNH endonuclease family protein [Actinomadura flavalba]|uniref:HNH endonuclease family protein n=1 Tax=Actinomadura flavalba TaxID=1120938 RepID=UPI000367DC71|nr:HNH endonuclease family protein [Actinomadura flavalba]